MARQVRAALPAGSRVGVALAPDTALPQELVAMVQDKEVDMVGGGGGWGIGRMFAGSGGGATSWRC